MDYQKIGLWVLGVLGGLAFLGVSLNLFGSAKLLGSAGNAAETYINSQWLVGGLQVGPTGTLNANSQFGSCNPTYYGTLPLAASSTGTFACTVSGIAAGDYLEGDLPATETGGTPGFIITSTYATTSNIVAFTVYNISGSATSSFKQATTGVEYWSTR
jgi:hypothetical protein